MSGFVSPVSMIGLEEILEEIKKFSLVFCCDSSKRKMKFVHILLSLWLWLTLVTAQAPNLDNVGDILQSLKDSGMMDKFEKDLKQMLFDQKAKESVGDKKSEETVDDNDPPVDVYEFMKAYTTEKKLKLNEKAMLYLMESPITEDLHIHLAKLTVVLDKIGEISQLNNKKVDLKVVETVKRVKSLSVMKTSLDKILSEGGKESESRVKPVSHKKPTSKDSPKSTQSGKVNTEKSGAEEVAEAITTFLEMTKAKPDQMIHVISTAVSAYNLISPKTLKSVEKTAKMLSQTDHFNTFIDVLIRWVEDFAATSMGNKLVEIAPRLIHAKTTAEVISMISEEMDFLHKGLVGFAEDPEAKNKAITSVANVIQSGLDLVHGFFKDEMKMTFANTFLLSQGFPTINTRNVAVSSLKLLDKLISIFTPWDIDVRTYEKGISSFIREFERKYFAWSDYSKMDDETKLNFLSDFLTDNLVEPGALLFTAYQHIASNPDCAEPIMCSLNARMKSHTSDLTSATTRGLSLLASWAWSMEGKVEFPKVYEAIWAENCIEKYTNDKKCQVFPWQMSLKIEHSEL